SSPAKEHRRDSSTASFSQRKRRRYRTAWLVKTTTTRIKGSCFRPRTSSVYFGNLGMPLLSSSSGGKEGLEAPRPSSACELAYLSGDTATH
ncbi:hypothetical protein PF004_g32992, partial [Phytophthora fragariae]